MYKRGDVFWADLSPVIGSEQDGVRPVVILQNDIGNKYSPTSNLHRDKHLVTHVPVCMQGLPQYSVVLLEQIRTVDKARLGNFVGVMDKETLNKIDESVMCSLGLTDGFRT